MIITALGIYQSILITKDPERRTFRDLLFQSVYNSGLADGVNVTGEVEHLVGEAPLVVVPGAHIRHFSDLPVYRHPVPAHLRAMSAKAPDNQQSRNGGQKYLSYP